MILLLLVARSVLWTASGRSKRLQDSPDVPQNAPDVTQDGPRTPQTAPRRPRRALGRPRYCPHPASWAFPACSGRLQDAPDVAWTPPGRPTGLQDALDARQDASEDAQVCVNLVFSRASETIFDRPCPEFVTEIVTEIVIEIVTETCDRANWTIRSTVRPHEA